MKPEMNIIDSDTLVIGNGIAGLTAVLHLLQAGQQPLLVTKPLSYVSYGTLLTRLTNSRCSFTSALSHLHTIIREFHQNEKTPVSM